MKLRSLLSAGLLVLLAFFGSIGKAEAQTLGPWQGICWQNVSSYDMVRAHFQNENNSTYDSNLTVNSDTIASTGQGSGYAGYRDVPGQGIRLGWVYVGGYGWHYGPSIDYSKCNPTFEDGGGEGSEGYFWFEGANYYKTTLTVSKAAIPTVLLAGAANQKYVITINVGYVATTAPILLADTLPTGITTNGAIAITGGILTNCPPSGATNLTGCKIAAGVAAGTNIVITVPIAVPASIGSHSANSVTNYAYASGGGDLNCGGTGCVGSTTNVVLKALDDIDKKPYEVQTTTAVSANDSYPANASFTALGGTCSSINTTPNTTGTMSYKLPLNAASCTVNYKVCAPSPNTSVCTTATLTVTPAAPAITASKLLGGNRNYATDQFTVQIFQGTSPVTLTGTPTTGGTTNQITPVTSGIGAIVATANLSYSINEVMYTGSTSKLAQYGSAVICTNNGIMKWTPESGQT